MTYTYIHTNLPFASMGNYKEKMVSYCSVPKKNNYLIICMNTPPSDTLSAMGDPDSEWVISFRVQS